MAEIKSVLDIEGIAWCQPQIEWGTIRVNYESLPKIAQNKLLVFVECRPIRNDLQTLIIDHHNELSENESSLLQVLDLLGLSPTLNQQIIASIDAIFLRRTIDKWPGKADCVLDIWRSGYRKRFAREKDFLFFENRCRKLYRAAKERISPEDRYLQLFNAPASMTMISAFADLDSLSCALISGSEHSDSLKPCFFQGNEDVVRILSQAGMERAYWGKYYLGCRSVPREFIAKLDLAYQEIEGY